MTTRFESSRWNTIIRIGDHEFTICRRRRATGAFSINCLTSTTGMYEPLVLRSKHMRSRLKCPDGKAFSPVDLVAHQNPTSSLGRPHAQCQHQRCRGFRSAASACLTTSPRAPSFFASDYAGFIADAARMSDGGVDRTRTSKRLGVADGDAENAPVGGLYDRRNAVAIPGDRRLDLAGAAAKSAHLLDAAHDIDMREGPPAVFAALHRADVPAVEADQQDRRRHPLAPRTQADPRPAVIESEDDRNFLTVAPREVERMFDLGTVRADGLPFAIDDDLRGIDRRKIEKRGVMVLALGRLSAGIRVLPAEPVPIIDMERQC